MAQTMRAQAVAAITDDGNFTGSTVYESVGGPSESAPDTGDYWNGHDNEIDVLELRMTDLSASEPGAGTCTVSIYETDSDTDVAPAGSAGTPATYDLEVYEGTTQRAARTGITPTSGTFTLANNLTFAAADVTDWSDIRIRFTSNGSGGQPGSRRGAAVSYMEISVPDESTANLMVNLASSGGLAGPGGLAGKGGGLVA